MLFNSFSFLFLFLPIAVLGFFIASALSKAMGRAWLVLMSLGFYTWWYPPFTVLLITSIAFNYSFGRLLLAREGRAGQSTILFFALACNLGALFYYKYAYTLASSLFDHGLTQTLWMNDVLLPLGISFFTFTQIGFLLDCRGGMVKDRGLIDYILFVTFFPHLIAGPILHHKEIMPQFAEDSTYRMDPSNVAQGLTLFFIGLFKKGLIADPIATYASPGFADPSHLGFYGAWGAALAYSLQLYFDFSGYSDMAIGIAKMCNVRFPINFNSPYRASNIIDFWQRWHMTLTRYLNLYLYNPMALLVARRRAARGLSMSRQATAKPGAFASMVALPLFFTMGLAGVWHGAGLQYLVFGLLHACYLTLNHIWRVFGPSPKQHAWMKSGAWTAVCVLVTYLAVLVAEVFFRAGSTADAVTVVSSMLGLRGLPGPILLPYWLFDMMGGVATWLQAHTVIAPAGPEQPSVLREVGALLLVYGIVFLAPNSQTIVGLQPVEAKSSSRSLATVRLQLDARWGVLVGLIAVAAIMGIGAKSEFLYFQF
jgi:D-alanyl-lipoteichoic acid acyltransferase DltB (MBOAT superfamily)